jgi:hypothetical protein
LLTGIEISARRHCVERRAVVDRGLALFLFQRRLEVWARLEYQPLRRANRAVDDGSLKKLARFADDMPAEPREPATIMQRIKEPLVPASTKR